MTPSRAEQEKLRTEIRTEREHLAGAVEHLRGEVGVATKAAAKIPLVAAGVGAVGLALKLLIRRR